MQTRPPADLRHFDALLTQLDREIALLRECRAGLFRLHANLRRGQSADTGSARSALAHAGEATKTSSAVRNRLLAHVAVEVGLLKPRPTLGDLIPRLPKAQAEAIRDRRVTLIALIEEIGRWHLRISHVVNFCQTFLHGIRRELAGLPEAGRRYGPTGAAVDAPRGIRTLVRG